MCVRSKSLILRYKCLKKQNLTHPKAAKLATLYYGVTDTAFDLLKSYLTLWCPRAIAVDSPPSSAPASGDQSRHNNS